MIETFLADTNVLITLIVREYVHFEMNSDSHGIYLIATTDMSLDPVL